MHWEQNNIEVCQKITWTGKHVLKIWAVKHSNTVTTVFGPNLHIWQLHLLYNTAERCDAVFTIDYIDLVHFSITKKSNIINNAHTTPDLDDLYIMPSSQIGDSWRKDVGVFTIQPKPHIQVHLTIRNHSSVIKHLAQCMVSQKGDENPQIYLIFNLWGLMYPSPMIYDG